MRIRLLDMISRAEPAAKPAMSLYLVLVTSAALSVAAVALGTTLSRVIGG